MKMFGTGNMVYFELKCDAMAVWGDNCDYLTAYIVHVISPTSYCMLLIVFLFVYDDDSLLHRFPQLIDC